jgi:hypothetical protein
MNENFVNIKVDREERPDVDHIYMESVQAMIAAGLAFNGVSNSGRKAIFWRHLFPAGR